MKCIEFRPRGCRLRVLGQHYLGCGSCVDYQHRDVTLLDLIQSAIFLGPNAIFLGSIRVPDLPQIPYDGQPTRTVKLRYSGSPPSGLIQHEAKDE